MKVINIPSQDGEVWKNIDGHPDYYISNFGNVYSQKKDGKMLTPYLDQFGYYMLHLWENNKQHAAKVHRLVADAFIPNPDNLSDVNHKDENKTNNRVENLEWCSRKYNLNYGTRNERANASRKKGVVMLDSKTFEYIKSFPSAIDAERETGINAGNIAMVCSGKRKTAGGYTWEYKKGEQYVCN